MNIVIMYFAELKLIYRSNNILSANHEPEVGYKFSDSTLF